MKLVKTASGKKQLKISKKEWESIGKKAGWMKVADQFNIRWFEWEDDQNGSGKWTITYRDILPDELYGEDGKSLSNRAIIEKMIISIQSEDGVTLTPEQILHFLNKLSLEEDFFELVQEANDSFRDEQRIEQRDIDVGL